jgi:hypothetical protein
LEPAAVVELDQIVIARPVLVDVSGKGIEAGTRALLLSGAMGGLLGSVDPDEFLIAANNYLRRQSWAQGFASAAYLRLNLESGLYSIRSAGHLPALHLNTHAASPGDAWRTSTSAGGLLRIRTDISVRAGHRTLRTGDVLGLYTDGVVEDPGKDRPGVPTDSWQRPRSWWLRTRPTNWLVGWSKPSPPAPTTIARRWSSGPRRPELRRRGGYRSRRGCPVKTARAVSLICALVMTKPAGQGTIPPWYQDGGDVWALDRDPLVTGPPYPGG